ncbi:MAG: FAD-dependent oxidoreductase [Desulfobacteraceae bacterium]|jgi:heterodisulfide reductase subunit A
MKMINQSNTVLVIGGGVGGMKAAMELSEAGRDAVLIDQAASIGGLMTRLDRTFPTNNCDLCTISPNLSENAREKHIDVLPLTRLTAVSGQAGDFTATLTSAPRYIDVEKCTACGQCYEAFPQWVRFSPGLDHRAPTCMRYPQATPQAFSIDMHKCEDPEALAKVCPAGAIIPRDTGHTEDRRVGAIVLAIGAEPFDPHGLEHFGHGHYPDVVTGLEYERIMSASGPTGGELVRPSDAKQPRRVAWIQCVGSRGINREDVSYCSGVCCMYALKEAIVTKERFRDDIETTIFYMDMRTFGKDYERYYNRSKQTYGIRFVQCRPHSVVPDKASGGLAISYAVDAGASTVTEQFDMVVLSTGFRPTASAGELAAILDIELTDHNFARTGAFSPVATTRPGIYVCGVFESPKDIPETMVQAGAAACLASRNLVPAAAAAARERSLPAERDVSAEEPRIGVFVCDCGQNISEAVDVDAVAAYAADLPGVVVSRNAGHGCSRDSLAAIRSAIQKENLNRIVIGGCSPRTHENLFQNTLREAGINKYLVEMANIRDQDTWVHMNNPELAMAKARDLVRMAVAGVARAQALPDHTLPMNKDVLVLGGGVSGMNAALELADHGHRVVLAEQAGHLGGIARAIRKTLEGDDVQAYMTDLIHKVTQHDGIEVISQAIVVDHSGMPGMYKTGFQIGPRMYYRQIEHGATVLATGAAHRAPRQFGLGEHAAVTTQIELDSIIEDDPDRVKSWDTLTMIQCVGSRNADNPNCSRICCQSAIKNALRALDLNPDLRIFVLYRDMRTYGFAEDYYAQARRRGVIFVRYNSDAPPKVSADGDRVSVVFTDPVLGMELDVASDCLALSTGMAVDEEATEDLAMIFHLNRTLDGCFLEEHVKLRPTDLSVPGFFVAGSVHAPKTIKECIAQAQAAASRVLAMLSKDTINLGATVARVDAEKCATCLACVRACPYGVPFINEARHSEIDPARCHGCGVCAAECPAKAIELTRFEDAPIMARLEGLFERSA